ncbi:hypothetical protein QBC33DRAFT_546325 [Phialemonium atrogriseum]|uniref:Uncharacterized protein n=1 Tax=Phialemonium atrogriseum TaxID=1093897 RepID=A0AAJ0BWV0_9PEZI|nr:uncharacterized protein QBC33DRAFT_546325 [Phialemonium atrogriseum]KAK1764883.1 hypothetical protein QBC33DRAFT_546325 [Phialemonium atrogriseum]
MMLLRNAPRNPAIDRDTIGIGHQPANPPQPRRKRKAENQPENNERLSKRLSLLNLEQNGSKLYVPVENPVAQPNTAPSSSPSTSHPRRRPGEDDSMQLDDSKHKVYIYNLEDEFSSSDGETDDGKLLFLPDVEKHLRVNRIPPQLLSNPAEDLKGRELVLYNVPSSITVPEEQDNVRKAILESRARIREKQQKEAREERPPESQSPATPPKPSFANGFANVFPSSPGFPMAQEDPEAMELD